MPTTPSRSRLGSQTRHSNLTMKILIRTRHIAAAEPYGNLIAIRDHGRVADHFRIPGRAARNHQRKFFPADSVARPPETQPPQLTTVAPRVQHPVISARCPHRRLAEAIGVERPV